MFAALRIRVVRLVRRAALLALAVVALVVALGAVRWSRLPGGDELRVLLTSSQIRWMPAADGSLHPRCRGPIRLDAEALPRHLLDAAVAIEDRRFHHHPGVDPIGTLRAAVSDLLGAGPLQGGSTIEMQIAKNLILNSTRSPRRKFDEMILALKIDRLFTGRQILALYLNSMDYGRVDGDDLTGIERAARARFGKSARRLTLLESALLVGALNNPMKYDLERHPAAARARAELVLDAMMRAGFITDAERVRALKEAIRHGTRRPIAVECRWFADFALERLRALLPDQKLVGLRVAVTWQPDDQLYADLATRRLLAAGRGRRVGQAALVSLAPTGAVRALVGGADYADSQFNRATMARRQPGSAFKLFDYLAALEAGHRLGEKVLDAPITIAGWTPRNADGRSHGLVTLRDALVHSLNQPTARLALSVGIPRIAAVARRLGIESPLRLTASLALGTSEVTLLELTAAYAPLANGGHAAPPYAIMAVLDDGGAVRYWRAPKAAGPVVVASQDRAALVAALSDVLRVGTARGHALCAQAAAKTGTTQDYRDAWIIGFTPRLVTGIWAGNDDATPMLGVAGGGLPADAWQNYMANATTGEACTPPRLRS